VPSGFAGWARVRARRADLLTVDVRLERPGYLVILDGFDSGWRATVGGAEAPVLRANVLFRAVALAAGRHVVEWRYRPGGALWGGLISLVWLTGALVFGWRSAGRG